MSLEAGKTCRWAEIPGAWDAEETPPRCTFYRDGHVVGFAVNRWQKKGMAMEIARRVTGLRRKATARPARDK